MSLPEKTQKAMRAWLNSSTCFSFEGKDEEHFYLFVATAWHELKECWSESETRDQIAQVCAEVNPKYGPECINENAEKFENIGSQILYFLRELKRAGRLNLLAD